MMLHIVYTSIATRIEHVLFLRTQAYTFIIWFTFLTRRRAYLLTDITCIIYYYRSILFVNSFVTCLGHLDTCTYTVMKCTVRIKRKFRKITRTRAAPILICVYIHLLYYLKVEVHRFGRACLVNALSTRIRIIVYIPMYYAPSDLLLRVCGVWGLFLKQETFVLNRPEVLRGRADSRNYLRPYSSARGLHSVYVYGAFC